MKKEENIIIYWNALFSLALISMLYAFLTANGQPNTTMYTVKDLTPMILNMIIGIMPYFLGFIISSWIYENTIEKLQKILIKKVQG